MAVIDVSNTNPVCFQHSSPADQQLKAERNASMFMSMYFGINHPQLLDCVELTGLILLITPPSERGSWLPELDNL
jgi:hypothetical protein